MPRKVCIICPECIMNANKESSDIKENNYDTEEVGEPILTEKDSPTKLVQFNKWEDYIDHLLEKHNETPRAEYAKNCKAEIILRGILTNESKLESAIRDEFMKSKLDLGFKQNELIHKFLNDLKDRGIAKENNGKWSNPYYVKVEKPVDKIVKSTESEPIDVLEEDAIEIIPKQKI